MRRGRCEGRRPRGQVTNSGGQLRQRCEMSQTTQTMAGLVRSPQAAVLVIDDFLAPEFAAAMRQDIDAHFAEPGSHRADIHQVWNYWFVPELYTYLRTTPEKIIRHDRVAGFVSALQAWSLDALGRGVFSHGAHQANS